MNETEPTQEPTADVTPIPESLRSPNDGGADFTGGEGTDENRTTRNPLHPRIDSEGESDSAEAVGLSGDPQDSAAATRNGGGGL